MKLIHLSDLHIGKRVNEFSMLEDQEYILLKIIGIIDEEKPDGVLISGDIYDKSVPSAEAVQLFDDFLVRLSKRQLKVFATSGNHDSAERIAFASRILNASGVCFSPVYDGTIASVDLADEFGAVSIYLLPFLKPIHVKKHFPDLEIESFNDAVRTALMNVPMKKENRTVLLAHQFVTGAVRCDSEEVSVGGLDNVDASAFDAFDYVALGHIHTPQKVGRETVRYCGTPLQYSFSEARDKKSVTVVELHEKGNIEIKTIPLIPKRAMRELKGTYNELTLKQNYDGTNREDYIHITLTDEEDIIDAMGKLRVIYPNIMKLDYDNRRTRCNTELTGAEPSEQKTPLDYFEEFFELQNNRPMSEQQRSFSYDLITQIWEDAL